MWSHPQRRFAATSPLTGEVGGDGLRFRMRADRLRLAPTLPLRGRVGAELRGGVNFEHTADTVTPTRRFAATSPLKGEVGGDGLLLGR